LFEAFVEQVYLGFLFVCCKSSAEHIIGIKARTLFSQIEKSKCATEQQVETSVLIKLFVTAPTALLEYAHRYQDTD
jgi:hypothetical protein